MEYKFELDLFDFRMDKFWEIEEVTPKLSVEKMKNELLSQLKIIESGGLDPQSEMFIKFTDSFQDICYSYPNVLTELIKPAHINFFLEALANSQKFEYQKQLIDVLFILSRDRNIKIYLYQNKIIDILFELFQNDESLFIPVSNIVGVYFIETNKETQQEILKYKIKKNEFSEPKSFYKIIKEYASDNIQSEDNLKFVHSALFLISLIIQYFEFESDKKISEITNILINRLNYNPHDVDLSDIIYCFCCLIQRFPEKIIIFSQTRVVLHFSMLEQKTQSEDEFIRYLTFLQYLIRLDGTHLIYFQQSPGTFLRILNKISSFSELSENCIIQALKALYFAIYQIPYFIPDLIKNNILGIILSLSEQTQYSIKELTFQILAVLIEKSDENERILILNSQNVVNFLESEQLSTEFIVTFLNSIIIALNKMENRNHIDPHLVSVFENLASSTESDIATIAQYILNKFFSGK